MKHHIVKTISAAQKATKPRHQIVKLVSKPIKKQLKLRRPTQEELKQAGKEALEENLPGYLYLAER
jgi:hypothetical protein